MTERVLIVGGDSLIGASLASLLEKTGADVTTTTRKPEAFNLGRRIYFDLASPDQCDFSLFKFSIAYFCAAITSIASCEANQAGTQQINVLNTVVLARRLLEEGTRIVFLSSSTVFDGSAIWPGEDAPCAPTCEYGRQKVSVERQLISLSTHSVPVTIVRLTKVFDSGRGVLAEFLGHLMTGKPCIAYSDLRICPISINYTTKSLVTIGRASLPGVFHLSGEEEMSYADFAGHLALHLGADPSLVKSCSSIVSAACLVFQPANPGLGMQETHKQLGISPESIDNLMVAILSADPLRRVRQ